MLAWTSPVGPLILTTNQVDLWRIRLLEGVDVVHRSSGLLSQDEIQRANCFHFERDKRRFIVARAAMRQILGEYLRIAPQDIVFSYGANGKPELLAALNEPRVSFNLSHSGELGLVAVGHSVRLGIDIEMVNPTFATAEVAGRFFSTTEVNTLRTISTKNQVEAFFRCWTRKEAYTKALGDGLSVPMHSFEVAFAAGVQPALLRSGSGSEEASRWSMYDIDVGAEYKAALVAEGSVHHLRRWQWKAKT